MRLDQQNSQPSDAGDRFRRLMNADEQVELDPTIDESIEEKEPTELASETDSEAGLENGDDTGLENSTRPNETEIQLDELNSTQPEPAFQPEETKSSGAQSEFFETPPADQGTNSSLDLNEPEPDDEDTAPIQVSQPIRPPQPSRR